MFMPMGVYPVHRNILKQGLRVPSTTNSTVPLLKMASEETEDSSVSSYLSPRKDRPHVSARLRFIIGCQ